MKVKKGDILIKTGLLLIVAALLLTAYNIFADYRAGRESEIALKALDNQIAAAKENSINNHTRDKRPLYESYPDMDMPQITIDGKEYIGIISIPSLSVELPVKGEFSYPALKTAPCVYKGSVYKDDLIIAGHNFPKHFGNLKNINIGSRMTFTDGDGNVFNYKASEIIQLDGRDVEGMSEGEWDMTLFTCTLSGKSRIAVRFEKMEE